MEKEYLELGEPAAQHCFHPMCTVCEQTPATVSCKADAAFLCSACDEDVHSANPFAFRHERLPISTIFDRAVNFLFDGEEDIAEAPWCLLPDRPNEMDGLPEIRLADRPFLETGFQQVDSVLAPINGVVAIDFTRSKMPSPVPDRSRKSVRPASTVTDREARVMRYREKRKNLRFERTIRYASRKACAEMRPRIKGRFAKRREEKVEFGRICSTAMKAMGDRLQSRDGHHFDGLSACTSFGLFSKDSIYRRNSLQKSANQV